MAGAGRACFPFIMLQRPRRAAIAVALLAILTTTAGAGLPQTPPAASVAPSASAAPDRSPSLDPAPIQRAIDALISDANGWGGRATAAIVDIESGRTIAAAGEGLFQPASVAKVPTAIAALRLLGADHRFFTGIYGAQQGDEVKRLVLRGRGDPTLTYADLAALAFDLKRRGVRKVLEVWVDHGFFDDRFVPPAFEQQPREWAPFRAPVSAVAVNANTLQITIVPTKEGEPALVTIDPPGAATLSGKVKTAKAGSPEKAGVSAIAASGRVEIRLSGQVPERGEAVISARRAEDPRLLPGYALREALTNAGISVGDVVKLGGEKERGLLASHKSAPLSQVLARLGKDSDNFVAEMIFKSIAAEKRGAPGSFTDAATIVSSELSSLGLADGTFVVKNGSGLFDSNRITAASAAKLLAIAHEDPRVGPDFVASLAIGGVDGTLRGRLKPWAAKRVIRAKTGTLNAVFALAGYVLAPQGRSPIAFAIFVNDTPGKGAGARKRMDQIVDASARALWGSP